MITAALSPPSSAKVTRCPGRGLSFHVSTRLAPVPTTRAETAGRSSTSAESTPVTVGDPSGTVTRQLPAGRLIATWVTDSLASWRTTNRGFTTGEPSAEAATLWPPGPSSTTRGGPPAPWKRNIAPASESGSRSVSGVPWAATADLRAR